MKELPIGRQTFSEFIEQNLLYVDKTRYVWDLVRQGKFYFLSRPRRFGKSLLLTTLKSFFEGREDLFRGLFIHEKVKEWKKHPVVHLDYSLVEYTKSREVFETSLLSYLKSIARSFDIEIQETVIQNAFRELIIELYNRHGEVVVLIDEYDKPLVDALTNEHRFEENREILRNLYGSIKGLDEYLRFVMLTGVSRFAKISVFSGMNNLEDISMSDSFNGITGFTQEELEKNFDEYLQPLPTKYNLSFQHFMEEVKFKYNGFSWDGVNRLYNPFSTLRFLKEGVFDNFWFSTGTPTFLIDIIKQQKQLPETLEQIKTADLIGSSMQIRNFPLVPLLFQTGYLTVAKVEMEGVNRRFILDYPNEEVRHSFLTYIAAAFVEKDEFEIQPEALELRDALREERPQDFIKRLQSFLADIPARLHIPKEAYFHSLVYMMLRLTGVRLLLEKETSTGRIDAVLEFPDKVYIIEFKFGTGSRIKNVKTLSRNALAQIETRQYHLPFLQTGKKIILFGIGFLDKQLDGRLKFLP